MTTLYKNYLAERKESMSHYITSAKNAMLFVRAEQKLAAWKKEINAPNKFYTDSDNVAHTYETEDGYKMVFKLEADYDNCRQDDINGQGYEVKIGKRNKPDFAEHGEFTRHSGKGIEAYIGFDCGYRDYENAYFDIPEKYMEQFYDNKNYSKHDAYIHMVASTRLAIEQDIKNAFNTEYYYISVTVFKDDEELESFGIGSIDEDYAISGSGFFDYSYNDAMDFINQDREERAATFACEVTASRPDMYELQA